MRRGVITHVAMNGSAAIHDFELAAFGGTSEDVAAGLGDGTFGMAEETGREMNGALAAGARASQGAGQALARALAGRSALPGGDVSVLAASEAYSVPVTVHAAIGAEIITSTPPPTAPCWARRRTATSGDWRPRCPRSTMAVWCSISAAP
jgi:hypothetical protein